MFTGIIEEIGSVLDRDITNGEIRFRISAPMSSPALSVNDSVATNGVCLTVIDRDDASFLVEAVEETLRKSTLAELERGSQVNLELPLRLNERLGGHLVLGHVDAVGDILNIEERESSWVFGIRIPESFLKYVVRVGSIAVDGVSLTISEIDGEQIRVSIIPHTMSHTIFKHYALGTKVNLEFDIVGKYIERMIAGNRIMPSMNNIFTEKHLRELGY